MFKLPSNTKEALADVPAVSAQRYAEIAPSRSVVGNAFPDSEIQFNFSINGVQWWNPQGSYLRLRCSLTKADGTTALTVSDGIGPAASLMANLFQSCRFMINGNEVSTVSSLLAQVDALDRRMHDDRAFLKSIGASLDLFTMSLDERINLIASDGTANAPGVPIPRPYTSFLTYDPLTAATTSTLAIPLATVASWVAATQTLTIPLPAAVIDGLMQKDIFVGDILKFGADKIALLILAIQKTAAPALELTLGGISLRTADQVAVALNNAAFGGFTITRAPKTSRAKEFEICWRPPLSIFRCPHALPVGEYSLVLQPQSLSRYQEAAIESISPQVTGANFAFAVSALNMYVHTISGRRQDDGPFTLALNQTRCQTLEVTTNEYSQKSLDVRPTTKALSVAFQDIRVDSNSMFPANKYLVDRSQAELNLTRLQVDFSGQQKPSPDGAPIHVSEQKDYVKLLYLHTMLQSGMFFSSGGCETLEEWKALGPYYHFDWQRDGQDRSTKVQISNMFSNSVANVGRLLLFDHSTRIVNVWIEKGEVSKVEIQD